MRPEKNSNNKQAVIDHAGHKTTKNRKIPRVCDVCIDERKTHLNILDLFLAIRTKTSNFIGDFSGGFLKKQDEFGWILVHLIGQCIAEARQIFDVDLNEMSGRDCN